MKDFKIKKIIGISVCLLGVIGLGININHYHTKNVNAQQNEIAQSYKISPKNLTAMSFINHNHLRSKEQKYRIYSHHYLAIEHRDINALKNIWNAYAKHTNYVSQHQYNEQGGKVYKQFHDGNYWSIFKAVKAPNNFKRSHMNNKTYQLINNRVLKAHGVFSGVNIKNISNNKNGNIAGD